MAVGMIVLCELCGKTYDSGRGYHPAHCDGGEQLRADEKDLRRFNKQTVDKRLEELYLRLRDIARDVSNIPWDGPIG